MNFTTIPIINDESLFATSLDDFIIEEKIELCDLKKIKLLQYEIMADHSKLCAKLVFYIGVKEKSPKPVRKFNMIFKPSLFAENCQNNTLQLNCRYLYTNSGMNLQIYYGEICSDDKCKEIFDMLQDAARQNDNLDIGICSDPVNNHDVKNKAKKIIIIIRTPEGE